MNFVDTPWQASTQFNVGRQVLVVQGATALINTAIVAGKTGASAPVWPTNPAVKTVDGGVTWLSQGSTTFSPLAVWLAGHNYGNLARSNYHALQVSYTLRPGGTVPVWNTTVGALQSITATWQCGALTECCSSRGIAEREELLSTTR
jgi:hypothetical protein